MSVNGSTPQYGTDGAFSTSGSYSGYAVNLVDAYHGSSTTQTWALGQSYNPTAGGGRYFQGYVGEVLVYSTSLSLANQQLVEAYLNQKWNLGIAGLPGGNNLLPATTPLQVASGSTLDLGGLNQQVAYLSDYTAGLGGSVINSNTGGGASILTLSPTGTSTTFSGVIAGGGTLGTINLVMSGSGAEVLAGSNTYTGSTTIGSNGTLTIGGAGVLRGGNYTATISNSGALIVNTSSNQTFSGAISGNGVLAQLGPGAVTLSASNNYTGGTAVSGGMLSFANTAAIPSSGTISVASGAYAGIPADLNTVIARVTTASAGVLGIDGGATTAGLNLTGYNGNLRIGSATSGTLSGSFTPQGTYRVGGGGGTLTITGNLADVNSTPTALEMNTSGSLPAGMVVLTGSNTYTGGTTVTAGTLAISGGSNRLSTSGNITVAGGVLDLGGNGQTTSGTVSFQGGTVQNGTLTNNSAAYNGGSGTVSAVLAGSAGLNQLGPGTLTLSASNTYGGPTVITGGTLKLQGYTLPVTSGLSYWLNATSGTIASLANGATVSSWADQSSNGVNFNGTATYATNAINGKRRELQRHEQQTGGQHRKQRRHGFRRQRAAYKASDGYLWGENTADLSIRTTAATGTAGQSGQHRRFHLRRTACRQRQHAE